MIATSKAISSQGKKIYRKFGNQEIQHDGLGGKYR